MFNRERIEFLKEKYPTGSRVRLIRMDDDQAPAPGTLGTIIGVDDIGSLIVDWDDGSFLNVIVQVDIVEKLASKR